MREDIVVFPALKVELRAGGQELEAGGGKRLAILTRQHRVELLAQRMKMQHVGRRIGELRVGQ